MNLWLDDRRVAPPGWTWAKSVNEARTLIEDASVGGDAMAVEWASLDHDLGWFASEGGDGVKLTDWFAEMDKWPTQGIRVHSANPQGVKVMLATIDRYGPYSEKVRDKTDMYGGTIIRSYPEVEIEWHFPDAFNWSDEDLKWARETYGARLFG